MEAATDSRVSGTLWTDGLEIIEGDPYMVEVERVDVDEIALHTFDNQGHGSKLSLYWSRERAVEVARQLLNAAALR